VRSRLSNNNQALNWGDWSSYGVKNTHEKRGWGEVATLNSVSILSNSWDTGEVIPSTWKFGKLTWRDLVLELSVCALCDPKSSGTR
jgi:hypothetical protein